MIFFQYLNKYFYILAKFSDGKNLQNGFCLRCQNYKIVKVLESSLFVLVTSLSANIKTADASWSLALLKSLSIVGFPCKYVTRMATEGSSM